MKAIITNELTKEYPTVLAVDAISFSVEPGEVFGFLGPNGAGKTTTIGLKSRANERLTNYSNGMKQRLLIARGILHDPEILFLDEPTRGLDPGIAMEIRRLITRLSQVGRTIFLTTHYMEEADRLCDRVAILDRGRIAALDTPEKLKHQYGETLEDVFLKLTGTDERM
jgi:ABC-2 type transport system ATP-binding protein